MANSADPDQTAFIGAVCSWSTLFASILNSSVMLGNYLQQTTSADDFSRRHFQMHFSLALRVNIVKYLNQAYEQHCLKTYVLAFLYKTEAI